MIGIRIPLLARARTGKLKALVCEHVKVQHGVEIRFDRCERVQTADVWARGAQCGDSTAGEPARILAAACQHQRNGNGGSESLAPSLSCSLAPSLPRSLPRSLSRSLAASLSRSLPRSLPRSLACSPSPSLTRSLAPSLPPSLARPLSTARCRLFVPPSLSLDSSIDCGLTRQHLLMLLQRARGTRPVAACTLFHSLGRPCEMRSHVL